MGSNNSCLNDKSINLYNNLKKTIKDMIYTQKFWADEGLCDKMVIVYYDKLIQYNKSDLVNVSMAIGIKPDQSDKINKNELCLKIVNHYKKRIDLMSHILNSITDIYNKIIHVQKGAVCQGVNDYVDDFYRCRKMNGIWLDENQYNKMIEKLKIINLYDGWYEHITIMNTKWFESMNKLDEYITIIKKDIDNAMDDELFNELSEKVNLTIKKMNRIVDIHYLLAVNYMR